MNVSLRRVKQAFPTLGKEAAQWARAMLKEAGSYHWYETRTDTPRGYGYITQGEQVMSALNVLLDGHGVEGIRGNWSNGYWCEIVASYINMGDTYDTTILYDREKRDFRITTFGDFVEQYGRKYGIQ